MVICQHITIHHPFSSKKKRNGLKLNRNSWVWFHTSSASWSALSFMSWFNSAEESSSSSSVSSSGDSHDFTTTERKIFLKKILKLWERWGKKKSCFLTCGEQEKSDADGRTHGHSQFFSQQRWFQLPLWFFLYSNYFFFFAIGVAEFAKNLFLLCVCVFFYIYQKYAAVYRKYSTYVTIWVSLHSIYCSTELYLLNLLLLSS